MHAEHRSVPQKRIRSSDGDAKGDSFSCPWHLNSIRTFSFEGAYEYIVVTCVRFTEGVGAGSA